MMYPASRCALGSPSGNPHNLLLEVSHPHRETSQLAYAEIQVRKKYFFSGSVGQVGRRRESFLK
jgi:hypothetical protein